MSESFTYNRGGVKLTHYPSSGRVGVEQVAENAVLDEWELARFVQERGLLAAHDAEVRAQALEEVADELDRCICTKADEWGNQRQERDCIEHGDDSSRHVGSVTVAVLRERAQAIRAEGGRTDG